MAGARPAHVHLTGVLAHRRRVLAGEEPTRDTRGHDRRTRRHHVGVADPVTGRGPVRHRPVGRLALARHLLGRTHGDDGRVVRRVAQLLHRPAVVATRHDDGDPVVPGGLDRVGQRVQLVVLDTVGVVGQQQHVDVVDVLVRHDPVDAGDHLRDVDRPVTRADLDVDHVRVGGDATEPGEVHTGRSDGCHRRAVPEQVHVPQVLGLGVERQVHPVDVIRKPDHGVDTGVEHRDPHPSTGQPGRGGVDGLTDPGQVQGRTGHLVAPLDRRAAVGRPAVGAATPLAALVRRSCQRRCRDRHHQRHRRRDRGHDPARPWSSIVVSCMREAHGHLQKVSTERRSRHSLPRAEATELQAPGSTRHTEPADWSRR